MWSVCQLKNSGSHFKPEENFRVVMETSDLLTILYCDVLLFTYFHDFLWMYIQLKHVASFLKRKYIWLHSLCWLSLVFYYFNSVSVHVAGQLVKPIGPSDNGILERSNSNNWSTTLKINYNTDDNESWEWFPQRTATSIIKWHTAPFRIREREGEFHSALYHYCLHPCDCTSKISC